MYRWNRPQYGVSGNGIPHLRIENRVMPAGPTIIDQVSNAAFWLGAMKGMADQYGEIRKHIEYSDLRENFGRAARLGIESDCIWLKGKKIEYWKMALYISLILGFTSGAVLGAFMYAQIQAYASREHQPTT